MFVFFRGPTPPFALNWCLALVFAFRPRVFFPRFFLGGRPSLPFFFSSAGGLGFWAPAARWGLWHGFGFPVCGIRASFCEMLPIRHPFRGRALCDWLRGDNCL